MLDVGKGTYVVVERRFSGSAGEWEDKTGEQKCGERMHIDEVDLGD